MILSFPDVITNEKGPSSSTVLIDVFQLPRESELVDELKPHEVETVIRLFGLDVPHIETVVSLCIIIPSEKIFGKTNRSVDCPQERIESANIKKQIYK